MCSCLVIQGSAAVATPLFDDLGAPGVAAWRQLIGGLTLVIVFRPRLRGRDLGTWLQVSALGAAMAAMNAFYYSAVERLSLGVAAALLYLGPFMLSAMIIRRGRLLVWPALALAGVLAITRPDQAESGTTAGLIFGALAAASLAVYTLVSQRLGSSAAFGELALAVMVSGLLLSPVAATNTPAPSSRIWITLALLGSLGVGLAFTLDYVALRLAGTAVVATLFALDPALGALMGLVLLGQVLPFVTVIGVGLVIVAGIGLTRAQAQAASSTSSSRRDRYSRNTDPPFADAAR